MLEEVVGVFSHTTGYRIHRIQCAGTEFSQSFLINQRSKIFVFQHFDLLDFVRSTETIEEVHERNAWLDSRQVSNTGQIHNFLYRTFSQHSKASLTSWHYILMVTEDTQCVRSQCTRWYMEYTWQEFTGNFVHVRDHQEKTLRSSVSSSQRTSLERTVNCTGSTAFRLHFLHQYCFAEDVLTSCGSPFVYVLSHSRRRSDGVDSCYFREHIRDMRCSLVTITSDEFLLFSHN